MKAYLQKLLDLIRTILAVIELADGGFRITKAHNEDLGTDMYRFWWKTEMLPQHGDITHLGPGIWSSMLNGSSVRLDLMPPDPDYTISPRWYYKRIEDPDPNKE